jgi:hypothetical protein
MRPSISSKRFFVCPKSRITAAEALNHPYLAGYQEELLADELQTKAAISPFDWSFTEKVLQAVEWQQKVVELIGVFNNAKPRDQVDKE